MVKETVGKISSDLLKKEPETRDPIELQREVHKTYEDNVLTCIKEGKTLFEGEFYVVVITKKERLMENVLRNYFRARKSCPTPEYDQTVYRYNPLNEEIQFLWVIPSKDTCTLFKQNAVSVVDEERALLSFVLDFEDGSLLRLAKKLNNEQDNSALTK